MRLKIKKKPSFVMLIDTVTLKLNNDKILSANKSAICTPIGKPESASPK